MGNKEEERRAQKGRKEGTFARCGGRQVSGRSRFTLAYANGDILQRERKSARFPRDEKRREREKKGRRGRTRPEEKSHQVRLIRASPLFILSARGSDEISGPRREDIRRSAGRAHPPTMGPSNDILLARLVTPHLPALCLSLPFLLLPRLVDLLVSLSSLFLSPLSRFAFPRGWIVARGYVRNCGTKCVREANSSPPCWRS